MALIYQVRIILKGEKIMPRIARQYKKSYSNVYHVILRSINQQEIFFDEEDKRKFLKYLKNFLSVVSQVLKSVPL